MEPLAYRMKSKTLNEFFGQEEIIGKVRLLYRLIKADKLKAILNFTKKPRTIQYLKIWNDGVDPFGYTSENIELCSGCAKEFDEFMRQKS